MDLAKAIEVFYKLIKEKKSIQALRYFVERCLVTVYRFIPHDGLRVMDQRWDFLIVLDACRYDAFKTVYKYYGRLCGEDCVYEKLYKAVSLGSWTLEWARKNFTGYYKDVIYISSNIFISNFYFKSFKAPDHFFKVIDVWKSGWNEELDTVPPEEVTKVAIRIHNEFPDKRLIIHYMQPHAPYIGKTRIAGIDIGFRHKSHIHRAIDEKPLLWRLLGKIEEAGYDINTIRRAYIDNLHLVLEEVKKLIKELDGIIVVTSDHGELLGEKFLLEHPEDLYVRELTEVPWLVIKKSRISRQKRLIRLKIKQKARELRKKLR